MTTERTTVLARPLARTVAVLAAFAYLPALLAAPGRMPADSKLYLYLDPGRFLVDAAGSFDPRQFAGWVPHQHISYLWPAGPWYWVFDQLGVPDWIAHRLWIGTLMVAAGLGVRWTARLLGLATMPAFAAAVVYQVSPYVLPYVSRTSVMLLPWAGLGWIVALTIRATRRHTWGDPAAIALVVLTVGAVNATALAMIVPGPLLWLVHAAWQRSATWRQVTMVALKVALFSIGVSIWWIVMLAVQGRHGAEVLPYSESLADVSLTATSAEVWRGLGYWLFYVRDPAGATTTESLRYLVSTPAILVSYGVPVLCLVGLVATRWAHRRFAALLVVCGVILAVGVHPIDDRSPLMRLLTGGGDSGLALALRSSTRALPVLFLGFALAAGALVAASATGRHRTGGVGLPGGALACGIVVAMSLANLPGMWTGAWVDPAIDRDHDPPSAWTSAAAALDAADGAGRVLQLPGAEFGAFRWGHTVDQPLPGLTETPLVTRDLLPLGSPAAMDLLFAVDDRIQNGTLEPGAIAPIARLLGVDTIWLTNDSAFDRFRSARPEVVRDLVAGAPGVGALEPFGAPFVNRPEIPMTDGRAIADPRVGRPVAPVELAPITDPGAVVRAEAGAIVVSGNGDGLVDAAAAGLVDGRSLVRYSGSLDTADRLTTIAGARALIVTDTNRSEARHWRSSQDVRGYTESNDPDVGLLREVASDQRLPLFDPADRTVRTYADQRGPVQATATSYGEPFAYLPEHRPYRAIDGDPSTAWLVGEHADPIGERLRLTFLADVDEITIRQPAAPGQRVITAVSVLDVGAGEPAASLMLDERSQSADGQPVAVTGRVVEIAIEAVGGGTPGTPGAVAAVGFNEIGHGLGATVEVVRPPNDALVDTPTSTPLAVVLTRQRSDPMDRWRDDPETSIVREIDLPTARRFEPSITARIDARSSDAELAAILGWPVVASTRLTGSPRNAGVAAFDGDPATAWITEFDAALGARLSIDDVTEPVSRIEVRQPVAGLSAVTVVVVRSGTEERRVDIVPDAVGLSVASLDPPLPPGPIEIEIAEIAAATTIDRRFGDVVELPASISEISISGGPSIPDPAAAAVATGCVPVLEVGEVTMSASFEIGAGWIDGDPIGVSPCSGPVEVRAGRQLVSVVGSGLPVVIDRVVLDDGAAAAIDAPLAGETPVANVTEQSRFARTVVVSGCADGCWLVLGEGLNPAWSASADGLDLGEPTLVDGGFNGWWIRPSPVPVVVELEWTAQLPVTIALIASLAIAMFALMILMSDRHRNAAAVAPTTMPPTWFVTDSTLGATTARTGAAIWVVAAVLLGGPLWLAGGLVGGCALVTTRRRRLAELTTISTVATVGLATAYLERRDMPFPGGGWPITFEVLHGFGMFAVASLLVGAVIADDADIVSGELDRSSDPDGDDDAHDDRGHEAILPVGMPVPRP